jgi:hypothetical protein
MCPVAGMRNQINNQLHKKRWINYEKDGNLFNIIIYKINKIIFYPINYKYQPETLYMVE